MYNDDRNSFFYQVREESGTIFLLILIFIVVNIACRAISYISSENVTHLMKNVGSDVKLNKFKRIYRCRRIISSSIMIVFAILFGIYSVSFCNIYPHTQRGWLYCGIWGCLFNWIIFAPLYIVIISVVEVRYKKSADAMNKLFLF